MAFQAPTRARQLTLSRLQSYRESHSTFGSSAAGAPLLTPDTEEWVVFSPSNAGATSTILSGTNRESDVGSIISVSSPRAAGARYDAIPGVFDEYTEEDEEGEEEEEEESLDGAETDSLQPFRENQDPVLFPTLPTHDGLGTFSSMGVSGFRSLEESLRIVAACGQAQEGNDTHSRIQKWRMEQGVALMDEIEKATRRRRRLSLINRLSTEVDTEAKLIEAPITVEDGEKPLNAPSQPVSDVAIETQEDEDNANESFLERITRSFIRDIMGIDDQLLEVLFGEALPAEAQMHTISEEVQFKKDTEERILNRIAKELGELVHLYTQHPSGASPTQRQQLEKEDEQDSDDGVKTPQPRPNQQKQPQQPTIDTTTAETATDIMPSPPKPQRSSSFSSAASSVPQFQFEPTLAFQQDDEASHAAWWGIEEADDTKSARLRREYWEQDLDVRLVFSYLKSRFCGHPGRGAPSIAASSTAATPSSSSAPIHHQHPLINRKHTYHIANRRQSISQSKPVSVSAVFSKKVSCASHDRVAKDRRSSKASSRSRGYYWDVATSVGSGQSSCVGTGVWAAI
ncbi:hypothetical protein FN846DRAFT_960522 [Sphaerosporella brunnea]|uniref:Uncharacterized protein n=1 Tax=Sphaerosporella brunnea TaxID=1250544 RepID=A0A5J5ERB9_9PEZI|nr:hypothetical protein FN846DRAFT_960522 [Sphaerosporella brunnea]